MISSLNSPFSLTSAPTLSNHLQFGLPLLIFPCTSVPIALLHTQSSYLLITRPYHLNFLSWTFFEISPTFVVPLILSFCIRSTFDSVLPSWNSHFSDIRLLLLKQLSVTTFHSSGKGKVFCSPIEHIPYNQEHQRYIINSCRAYTTYIMHLYDFMRTSVHLS